MAGFRRKKLEEMMKRILGDALLKEMKDPRIGFASIHKVELSKDYSVANVYVSVLGTENQKKKTIHGLIAAKGFLRFQIGKNMRLRFIPELKFHLDDSIEKGVDLVDLIDSVAPHDDEDAEE